MTGPARARGQVGGVNLNQIVGQLSSRIDRALKAKLGASTRPGRTRPQRRRQNRAMANAAMRSIPRAVPDKAMRFTRGALRNTTFAPRGHGYYDAFAHQPDAMVLSSAIGPCTSVEGYAHFIVPARAPVTGQYYMYHMNASTMKVNYFMTANLPHEDNSTLIFFNPGSSDSVIARTFNLKLQPPVVAGSTTTLVPNNTAHVVVEMSDITASQFDVLQQGDGPVTGGSVTSQANTNLVHDTENVDGPGYHTSTGRCESIPVRGSIRFRNISEALAIGGEVRIMRYNGGINTTTDLDDTFSHGNMRGADAQHLIGSVMAHLADGTAPDPNGTAADYGESAMDVNTYLEICDMMRNSKRSLCLTGENLRTSMQSNTYPADAIRSQTFQVDTSFEEAMRVPKYSTFIMLIDNFQPAMGGTTGRNNSYSFATTVQRAARFRPGTLLYSLAKTPAVHPETHNAVTKTEADSVPVKPIKQRIAPDGEAEHWYDQFRPERMIRGARQDINDRIRFAGMALDAAQAIGPMVMGGRIASGKRVGF